MMGGVVDFDSDVGVGEIGVGDVVCCIYVVPWTEIMYMSPSLLIALSSLLIQLRSVLMKPPLRFVSVHDQKC